MKVIYKKHLHTVPSVLVDFHQWNFLDNIIPKVIALNRYWWTRKNFPIKKQGLGHLVLRTMPSIFMLHRKISLLKTLCSELGHHRWNNSFIWRRQTIIHKINSNQLPGHTLKIQRMGATFFTRHDTESNKCKPLIKK